MQSFKQYLFESEFHNSLKKHYPDGVDVYHESPGHVKASMEKRGLDGEYGIFGTVGQNSNFVTSPKKTIVHFKIPHSHVHHISPDMTYGTGEHEEDPEKDFMRQHKTCKGGDICYHGHDTIPKHWIKSIKEIG